MFQKDGFSAEGKSLNENLKQTKVFFVNVVFRTI